MLDLLSHCLSFSQKLFALENMCGGLRGLLVQILLLTFTIFFIVPKGWIYIFLLDLKCLTSLAQGEPSNYLSKNPGYCFTFKPVEFGHLGNHKRELGQSLLPRSPHPYLLLTKLQPKSNYDISYEIPLSNVCHSLPDTGESNKITVT